MTPSQRRALLFDLDDTLYSEREYVRSGFRAVSAWASREIGIPEEAGFASLWRLFEGGARRDTFDQWLSNTGVDPDLWRPKLLEVYRGHMPSISPYPEVPTVLESLSRETPLGLVSDGFLATQQRKLDALGLRRLFSCVILTDVWGRAFWKPSTRGFDEALRHLGVEARAAAYIGDNPLKDFAGPRQLGMATIRVRREDGLYSALEPVCPEEGPDVEISSLLDLGRCLVEIDA